MTMSTASWIFSASVTGLGAPLPREYFHDMISPGDCFLYVTSDLLWLAETDVSKNGVEAMAYNKLTSRPW